MWIQLKQSVFTHRKTVAVAEALDMEEVHVVGHLGALWSWALDNASNDGIITASERTIEKAAYWAGPRGSFVAALVAAGYLHVVDGGFSVHDWEGHIGKLLETRAANAARQRMRRERLKTSRDATPDTNGVVTRDVTVTSALRHDGEKRREDKNNTTPLPPSGGGGENADAFDPTEPQPLPPAVIEALAGCPDHWHDALRRQLAMRQSETTVTSPGSYCLAVLSGWKSGKNPPSAPPPPPSPPRVLRPAPPTIRPIRAREVRAEEPAA